MDSPALPAVLTALRFRSGRPARRSGSVCGFMQGWSAGRQAGRGVNGAAGDVRSAQARLTAGRAGSTQEHSTQEQESGRKLRACTLPQTGSCTRAIFPLFFPLFFSLNFRRNPGETG